MSNVKIGDKVRILETNFAWHGIEGIVVNISQYPRIPQKTIKVEYPWIDESITDPENEEYVSQAIVDDGCFDILDADYKIDRDHNSRILNRK